MDALGERMAVAATKAIVLTETYFGAVLDFSEDSVAAIESLVDDVHYAMPGGKTPANIDLLCRSWGAYLGEVFRRNVGGEWIAWEDEYGKAVALRMGGLKVFPHDKVRKRFLAGAEHNLRDYYFAFRDQTSAVG